MAPGETLWLAQHRDDQAETFLLAALRGSGVRGLAGMPTVREWQGRCFARPLLAHSRAELEAEAARLGLNWIDDPTNRDEALDRNFLRLRLLPLLQARWPHAAQALASSAAHATEADSLIDDLAAQDLAALGGDAARLPLAGLAGLSPARQRVLVRHACRRLGLPTPPQGRLATLLAQLEARPDAQAHVAWAEAEARIWRGGLHLLRRQPPPRGAWPLAWDGRSPLATPWGKAEATLVPDEGGEACLELRQREGGERLRLAGRGSRELKRLLQEAALPPWARERVVVVWHAAEPVAALALPEGRWLAVAAGWSAHPVSSG